MSTSDPIVGRYGEDVERLLAEVEAVVGPGTWPRVEALVTALVGLYGAGLERMLELARAAAESRTRLDARLVDDPLVSSLLLVHGLHPVDLEERIALALRRLSTELPATAPLELVGVDDGIVKLRPADGAGGRPPAMHLVARAIEREAPEVSGLEIEGLPAPSGLVPASRLLRGGRP